MGTEAALESIRAVVETIAPASAEHPGGAELDVHRHVAHAIDAAFPGFVDMMVMLLDAFASDVRPGASFPQLSPDDRTQVLRAMSLEQSQDMREIVGALFLLTYGGLYSEWTGYDRATGRLEPPWTWSALGFRGPVRGNPQYRTEPPQ